MEVYFSGFVFGFVDLFIEWELYGLSCFCCLCWLGSCDLFIILIVFI